MIYIIYGDEEYLIQKNINKIINDNINNEIIKISGFDRNFNIKDLVDDFKSISLFASKNLYLIKDPSFLIKKEDENIDSLIEYCHNPDYENDVVFYTLNNNFNDKLKTFKDISSNAQVIKCNKLKKNDFSNECFNIINENKLKINRFLANKLINSCNNSLKTFAQIIEIIQLYDDEISEEVLNQMISNSDLENIFVLINALTNKQISEAYKLTKRHLYFDDNVNGLISLLANQLRFLYEINYYKNKSFSINEIMDITNIKSSYRIEKAFESLNNINENEILRLLSKLADLDYTIKNNYDVDPKLQFELFITSLLEANNA